MDSMYSTSGLTPYNNTKAGKTLIGNWQEEMISQENQSEETRPEMESTTMYKDKFPAKSSTKHKKSKREAKRELEILREASLQLEEGQMNDFSNDFNDFTPKTTIYREKFTPESSSQIEKEDELEMEGDDYLRETPVTIYTDKQNKIPGISADRGKNIFARDTTFTTPIGEYRKGSEKE
eukprot:gb/GECH01001101.1/.p1 GENE.gb/GECH01001101.1/~~gb/GECH01001101.1/.p1  ORF type:complete len:179 (+),score=51.98 gb/GECH01001101.1/:1-537(+)